MKKRIPFAALFLVSTVALAQHVADIARFTINQGKQQVGQGDFSLQKTPRGYSVISHGNIQLPNTTYAFSGSGILDSRFALVQETLSGVVNREAVNFTVAGSGSSFKIDISASGKSYQNSLSRTPLTVLFPDFDLSSYEILLRIAASSPGAQLQALIPKETGSLSPITLAAEPDQQGTLSGASVTVHHTSMTIGQVTSELYYITGLQIMEVDIPSQGFAMPRQGFQLQQPPPPPNDQPSQQ